jgi:hypothetical protein
LTAALVRVDAGVTKPIIGRPLIGVVQNLVSFAGLFELFFRIGVIRVSVRVILHGEPAIGLLQLRLRGGAIKP